MHAKRRLVCAGALLACACVPGPGPFRLPEVSGRVVDADSGAPIADAEVIEWHRGAGVGDGERPVHHARWDTTGPEGRFRLAPTFVSNPRAWLLKTYEPVYAFYHPAYGIQRGARPAADGGLVLRGSLARAAQARADLQPFCRGERDDAGSRRLAEVACTPAPERPGG